MDWRQKIRKLLEGKNASELARGVGLHPSAIGGAASQGNIPRANKAVRIARALGVSADWLFNDERDWPPPSTDTSPELTDYDLVEKLTNLVASLASNAIAIGARLTRARIERMKELAGMKDRSPEEQRELEQGFRDIALYDGATHRRDLLLLSIEFIEFRDVAPGGSFLDVLEEAESSALVEAFIEYRSRHRRKSPTQLGWAKPPREAYDLPGPGPKERPDSTKIPPF